MHTEQTQVSSNRRQELPTSECCTAQNWRIHPRPARAVHSVAMGRPSLPITLRFYLYRNMLLDKKIIPYLKQNMYVKKYS